MAYPSHTTFIASHRAALRADPVACLRYGLAREPDHSETNKFQRNGIRGTLRVTFNLVTNFDDRLADP
jgi:hypothetical protein